MPPAGLLTAASLVQGLNNGSAFHLFFTDTKILLLNATLMAFALHSDASFISSQDPSFITRSEDAAGLRRFLNNNTGNVMNAQCCCCLQVRGQTMTLLMAYGFRFLTRSALTLLTSIWETGHVSLLTETVNNVSKTGAYVHWDVSLRVSKGKQDCSPTGSQQRQTQTRPARGYRQCWQHPHVQSSKRSSVEVEARHLITEHIKQCCFIHTELRWWRVGPNRDEGRHFTLCWDQTLQIVAALALITRLWVHKQRPALAPLRVCVELKGICKSSML